jgi:hypothetical protein
LQSRHPVGVSPGAVRTRHDRPLGLAQQGIAEAGMACTA